MARENPWLDAVAAAALQDSVDAENHQESRSVLGRFLNTTCVDLQMAGGRRDLLHSCQPGPVDEHVRLLVKLLVEEQSVE